MDWTDRYTTPLADVFTRGHKLALEHRVELALLKALGKLGKVPTEAYDEVKAAVDGEARFCRRPCVPRLQPAEGRAALAHFGGLERKHVALTDPECGRR